MLKFLKWIQELSKVIFLHVDSCLIVDLFRRMHTGVSYIAIFVI